MAVRELLKPYATDLRYEELTGGLERRQVHYLLKRRLGYEPEEVEAMPWYRERMWLEGVMWEATGFKEDQSTAHDLDDLAAMGITVRKV
jgi:hypothetical protein